MNKREKVEQFFEHNRLILDIAGLSQADRHEGSVLLGGSSGEFVEPGDEFSYDSVARVLFRWGDKKAEDIFAILIEHIESPSPHIFAFGGTTLIGRELWSLVVQDPDFDPASAYESAEHYCLLPFDEAAAEIALSEYFTLPIPRPELLGKVGTRYVLFEMGIDLDQGEGH